MATWDGRRPLHKLLRPAGLPSARITQRTHYPSKYFLELYNEGCAIEDLTNPSMRLIHGSWFTSENSFMFDGFCGREDQIGLERYSPQSKKEHLGWLAQNMKCKVDIIYRTAGRERALAQTKCRGISLLLWGQIIWTFQLYLVYVRDVGNDRGFTRYPSGDILPLLLERIVVFIKHTKTFCNDWRPSAVIS